MCYSLVNVSGERTSRNRHPPAYVLRPVDRARLPKFHPAVGQPESRIFPAPYLQQYASEHLMPVVPVSGGLKGASGHHTKENQDSRASMTSPESRPIKIDSEPGTQVAVFRAQIPFSNSSINREANHQEGATVPLFEPRLTPGRVAEAEHRQTKAARSSFARRRSVAEHGARLQEDIDTIQALKARVSVLEKLERRLKSRLHDEKESSKDAQTDLQAALHQASILEERLDNEKLVRRDIENELERYRRWWLNEHYSLKAALGMIGDPDAGLLAMGESSCARYRIYLASQSDSV